MCSEIKVRRQHKTLWGPAEWVPWFPSLSSVPEYVLTVCTQGCPPNVQALQRASGLRGSLALAELGLLLRRVLCTLQTTAGHVLTRHPLSWLSV